MWQRIKKIGKWRLTALTLVGLSLGVAVAVNYPVKKSYALCEVNAQVSGAQGSAISSEASAVASMISSIMEMVNSTLPVEQLDLLTKIRSLGDGLRNDMGDFWGRWNENYQKMTAQLNTGIMDQTRTVLSAEDAANQVEFQREIQQDELAARRENTPSEESCVFDTTLPAMNRAEQITRAASNAISTEASSSFLNTNTSGGGDDADNTVTQAVSRDWNTYTNLFCNPGENGGASPCTEGGLKMDADINISQTLFGRDTLRIETPQDAQAITAAIDNLMGRPRSSSIPPEGLKSLTGQQQMLEKRSTAAQLNVAASVMGDIVGERLPLGVTVQEMQNIRESAGMPLSETSDQPSKYEMREGYLEFVNSPEFFKRLGGNSATLAQKDVHVKALRLMTLDTLVSKMERLSTLFAIQLSNSNADVENIR